MAQTKVTHNIENTQIALDAAEIPNLAASKITSGTFSDARIAASSVNQHATSFDDNKLINDISTLGLRVHTQENLNASNTNSASFDVFQDSSGITNLTNSLRDSNEFISTISVSAGSYETGNRTSTYTITMPDITVVGGSVSNLVDGDYSTGNSSTSFYWSPGTNAGNDRINFDLGSGNSKVYVGARWNQDSTDTHGTWKWQGSNDNANFTDLSSNFTLGGSTSFQEQLWSNTNAFRYIHLRAVSGSRSNGSWNQEAEFKVSTVTANATGSFEGATITAGASTSKMGAVLTYQDNAGVNTLNTDIILKLSADNGSNYSTATLTALPDFATGIKMAKVNDLSVTAGTQLKYKLEFANQSAGSKEARIRGVSLQY